MRSSRAAGVRTLSLHPMFGPSKSLFEPLTFVLAAHDDLTHGVGRHGHARLVVEVDLATVGHVAHGVGPRI